MQRVRIKIFPGQFVCQWGKIADTDLPSVLNFIRSSIIQYPSAISAEFSPTKIYFPSELVTLFDILYNFFPFGSRCGKSFLSSMEYFSSSFEGTE